MTDAFQDVIEDSDDDAETTTITDTTGSSFTDGVRSEFTNENVETDTYSDPDGTGSADDVDPRKLFADPTLDELRHYAREGPYGSTIVTKPIEDAFKHGFDVADDNTERDDGSGSIEDFLTTHLDTYKKAKKKARRDGHCVLMHQVADDASSAAEPIRGNGEFRGFQIWTVDNLSDQLTAADVAPHTNHDQDQIYVSEGDVNGGVAIVDDISNPDHGDVVGYGIEPRQESTNVQSVQFVHADRCQHFTTREWVDGDVGNNVTGEHVGESVLTNVLQPLKGAQMGYWAMKNILFRYSAPLHAVEPPESWSTEDWNDATEQLENLSMMSDGVLPPGSELTVAEGVSEFDPEPVFAVLVESICAGTVFTKSVLQGTQSGTVTGSETDIKGYFNEIHLLRQQDIESDFHDIVEKVATYDQETIPRVAGSHDFDIEWGPLFKPTDVEKVEGAVSLVTAATNAIKNYVLTPDEARSLVAEEWTTFDIDVGELEELSEEDWDDLDRINIREAGRGPQDDEPDTTPRQNPRQQNGGGQVAGENRESSQPQRTTDALSELSEETLREELERRE